MASKIINIAIGLVAIALLITGATLAYLHFRPSEPTSMDRTLEKWQQAVKDDPGNSLVRANLGATYLDMGDYDAAIKELKLALDQQPESFTYMFRLGFAYRGAEQYDEAIGMFLGSAERTPPTEKYPALFEAANTYMMKGDVASAKDYVQQSIADNDMIWNSHSLLGQILEQEGDTAGAKVQYEAAAKFNPTDAALQEALQRVSD
ncbi:MAG: tetratricopeptide repeat protein [Thermoleophilia bacterium]